MSKPRCPDFSPEELTPIKPYKIQVEVVWEHYSPEEAMDELGDQLTGRVLSMEVVD